MKIEIRATITLETGEEFDHRSPDGRTFLVKELRTSVSDEADKLFARGLWLKSDGTPYKRQGPGAYGTVHVADLPEGIREKLRQASIIRPRQPKTEPRHLHSLGRLG